MAPLFTIGIPTYNRAGYLRKALAAAESQTLGDLEVLVSDNASTDETAAVVRGAGGRTRYLGQETNVGASANFLKLIEAANGKYFSFLQDDDLVHCDFARRAAAAFERFPDADLYMAYSAQTWSPTTFYCPSLFGPPFPLEWFKGEAPRRFDGGVVIPLSLWLTVAIPPAIAFRTEALRKALPFLDLACPLFLERMFLAEVAAEGAVIADPWVAAMFLQHPQQNSKVIMREAFVHYKSQWLLLANYLARLVARRGIDWEPALRELLPSVAAEDRIRWVLDNVGKEIRPADDPFYQRATTLLMDSLGERAAVFAPPPPPPPRTKTAVVKDWVRDLLPPLCTRVVSRALEHSN
jgi:glycosyltransferase involved in cell wall biosynthesis